MKIKHNSLFHTVRNISEPL